jgi:hypothetical protein
MPIKLGHIGLHQANHVSEAAVLHDPGTPSQPEPEPDIQSPHNTVYGMSAVVPCPPIPCHKHRAPARSTTA